MDVYNSPPHRVGLLTLVGVALVLSALAASAFALLLLHSRNAELAELRGRVQTLDREVGRLRADSGALAGRVGSAEQTLRRGETGIAPLAKRVLTSVFTVEAHANPGNSGGPALARNGRVFGVLVSGGGENVNFVVPIEGVCRAVRSC